jgi:hypothetical protein
MHRVTIDYPSSPLRYICGATILVLSDAVWQMEIDAPEWAKIASPKLLFLPMTHVNTLERLRLGI